MAQQQVKRIVCLAYSRMPGGRCIAGRELLPDGQPGSWIRPVSGHDNEGVRLFYTQYQDGELPRLLDVIDVPVLEPQPKGHQQENWLIDAAHSWVRVGELDISHLSDWVDEVDILWVNGDESSEGQNNRVNELEAKLLSSSLFLIEANIELEVIDYYGKRVQGQFRYNGIDYCMRVTDPAYEKEYKPRGDGFYPLGRCFLCISLAGAYKGHCYKLIAAIIKP